MKSNREAAWQEIGRVSRRAILMVLLGILGTGSGMAWAGINVWTSLGPDGGSVLALAINPQNPSTVYAGTQGGIFKSIDGGKSWSGVNSGLAVLYVNNLAIDPQNTSTVYAVAGNGIFKTMDGGKSWNAMNSGLPTYSNGPYVGVNTLAIDPRNPTTLYVGICCPPAGVFKSTDGGASWSAANSGLPGNSVSALAIDSQNTSTLYAATNGFDSSGRFISGVFKSTDGGASWDWRPVNAGLPDRLSVNFLAIDPQTPKKLYAATSGGGVFAITFVP